MIHNRYFKNFRNGTFIELGAVDGVTLTNTRFFEDTLGWSGVLIEPQKEMYDRLKVNRPNCKNYNVAISDISGTTTMLVNNNTDPIHACVSALEQNVCVEFKDRFNLCEKVLVNTAKLSDILKDAGIKYIDFFSLDVEGSEYDVLCTMDWSIPVHVFLIETLAEFSEVHAKVRAILAYNGYVYDCHCPNENELWINPNYPLLPNNN